MHLFSDRGFTLVELIVGIVVLAGAMLLMNTMLISQSKDALQPVYHLRSSQLGQGIMQSILARAYDEHSDHNGGIYRCGEIWGDVNLWYDGSAWQSGGTPSAVACSAVLGRDGGETAAAHPDFNDVDDFITTGFVDALSYGDLLGNTLSAQYSGYAVQIAVAADSSSGILMKRIDITIRDPGNSEILFSALKGNY